MICAKRLLYMLCVGCGLDLLKVKEMSPHRKCVFIHHKLRTGDQAWN